MDEAEDMMRQGSIMGDAVSHYKKHIYPASAIAFCCTVAHCEAVAKSFQDAGINGVSLTGENGVKDKRKEWVAYGEDNNYYNYLIDLFTSSTTNNAVINGISNMIYGKGLDALDSSTKTDEYAALKSIFNNDCLKKIL